MRPELNTERAALGRDRTARRRGPPPCAELTELMVHGVTRSFSDLEDFHLDLVRRWVRDQLARPAVLGVLTLRDVQQVRDRWGETKQEGGIAELTAAGVPVAVGIAEELGIVVLTRPDPATATARETVSVLNEAETPAPVALAVLTQVGELLGEHAAPAVETMRGGPHDSFAVHWLVGAGALDPTEVEPERLLRCGIDLLAVAYDVGGPEDLLDALAAGHADQDAQLAGRSPVTP